MMAAGGRLAAVPPVRQSGGEPGRVPAAFPIRQPTEPTMPDPRMPPPTVHVVGAPGALRETVVHAFDADDVHLHDDVGGVLDRVDASAREAAFVVGDDSTGLALLLGDSVPASDALRVLRGLASDRTPWIVGLVEAGPGGVVVRTLSLGWARTLDDLARYARGEDEPPLELRDVVRHVARARHDINNPLTSALAQTQLLLLEHGDGEMGEELRDVEIQIKRIADLVAATASIRPRDG